MPEATDPHLLQGIVLVTDGHPTRGQLSASVIREVFDGKYGDLPMYLHAIAMGDDPKSDWLKTYVGSHGMIGYAPTPEHVGVAFNDVIGKLHGVDAIFSAKVTIVRAGKVLSEHTHQLGVKTTRRVMTKFDINALDPEMRLRPGDVITVSSMGHTETVEVEDGTKTTIRADLWEECEAVTQADNDMNDVQELVNRGSVWQAMEHLKIASERSAPEAVRNRLRAAYRSLSSHSPEEDDEEEDEEDGKEEGDQEYAVEQDVTDGPNYRSLGACSSPLVSSVGKKSKRSGKSDRVGKFRTQSVSYMLAAASSLTGSQY